MSSLTIAVVAEGQADQVVIKAALTAMVPGDPPRILGLQPESTDQFGPESGNATPDGRPQGWCGVLEWCRQYRQVEGGNLEDHPLLTARRPDLLILHLDADVAEATYTYCRKKIAAEAAALATLPCVAPCPPPCPPVQPPADALEIVLRSWLSPTAIGPRTVICIPSKAIDSWVAAALPDDSGIKIQGDIECDPDMPARLDRLPNELRVRLRRDSKPRRNGKHKRTRKRSTEYLKHAPRITAEWSRICERCSQARRFREDLLSAIAYLELGGDSSVPTQSETTPGA